MEEKMTIDEKLIRLADKMDNMASNDMGDLTIGEAALFHTACAAIDNLLLARRTSQEDQHEHRIQESGLPAHDR
jgi:hypothetical protein